MRGYKILSDFSAPKLNKQIADHMEQGWIPLDTHQVHGAGGGSFTIRFMFSQAMVLPDSEDK